MPVNVSISDHRKAACAKLVRPDEWDAIQTRSKAASADVATLLSPQDICKAVIAADSLTGRVNRAQHKRPPLFRNDCQLQQKAES